MMMLLMIAMLASLSSAQDKATLASKGVDYMMSGDMSSAVKYLTMASKLIPAPHDSPKEAQEDAFILTNLGTAQSEVGMDHVAALSYKRALSIDPTADTYFYLGQVLQDSSRLREAADAYAAAAELDPLHWEALANLGGVLLDLRDVSSSTVALSSAIALLEDRSTEPTNAPFDPFPMLSRLHYLLGTALTSSPDSSDRTCISASRELPCDQLAQSSFSQSLKYDPSNTLSKHMLASLTADATMTRASNDYVTALFDDYAPTFEASLTVDLRYTGYALLRAFFDEAVPPRAYRTTLDAGCGTGLAGEQFRNITRTLIGVDLSAAIIEQATIARPGLYDRTFSGDVVEVLMSMPSGVDLVIAADSFIYFGDLTALISAVSTALSPGGMIAFTLESVPAEDFAALTESNSSWRWTLTPSGRFAHRKSYVASTLQDNGMRVEAYREMVGFRYENGKPVAGHIFIARKV